MNTEANPVKPVWQIIIEFEERLAKQATISAQINIIIQTIEDNLDCLATIWLDLEDPTGLPTETDIPQKKILNQPSTLMNHAIKVNQCVSENQLPKDLGSENSSLSTEKRSTTRNPRPRKLAIPLKTDSDAIGAIQIEREHAPAFSKKELELFEGLASQASIMMQDRSRKLEGRQQLALLELVSQVSAQIADVFDLDELARQISKLILHAFKFYYVAIFTLEKGEDYLRFRGSAGPGVEDFGAEDRSPVLQVKIGEGIIGSVAEQGQSFLANDVRDESIYRQLDILPDTRAELAIPIKKEDNVLGVLDVQSDHLGFFLEADILILNALADNIASAAENVRLYVDLNRRAEQLSSVGEISNAIVSILDLDELLKEVVFLIHRRFNFPDVRIYTVNYGKMKIIFQAGIHNEQKMSNEDGKEYDLSDTGKLIPYVVKHRESVLIRDYDLDGRFPDDRNEEARSELVIPLIFGGTVQGALDIQNTQPDAFQQDDLPLFEALSDNIATAIRNAGLYRSETWRRKVAESMREVAGLLTADADLNLVLDRILAELHLSLPSDASAIWLFREDDSNQNENHQLFLAAFRIETTLLESLDLDIDELLSFYDLSSLPNPWLVQALESDPPMIRTAQMPYEPLGAILDFPPEYSAIAAPLRVNEQPIGILTLSHHSAGRYGSESQIMTSTFASYAAVAIENMRLYEAAHDQAWVSTVLLQVAEATQSITSMDELVQTMVRITPMLLGVKGCGILTWDAVSETFEPLASEAMSSAQKDAFARLIIHKDASPTFDQLLDTLQMVHISQEPDHPALNAFTSLGDPQRESIVLFPMVAHNNLLGTFLIIYDNPQSDHEFRESDSIEDKLAIIQGVAHQTAIAIENINLIRAQKEEAYVSVALLQVAQAVVSLNELEEILGAIVRLTPILVGVRRCIIFLWDNENAVFQLSEEYGLSRNETHPSVDALSPERYPVLDAVRRKNNLCYIRLSPELNSVAIWDTLSTSDFSTAETFTEEDFQPGEEDDLFELALTGSNFNKEFLRSQAYLLLAFPLSIKGTVLGVMVTVENEMHNTFPPYPVREKRLEITTGITQQAALAIQNDLLQHEVVARERLEREFQLARDIQIAFLPEKLPELEGWDIDIRWQPARQVSGDFYDVFELPDHKIGIVIADVADKGMPAALFMTLVRTLIRATVRELTDPSDILERVNNLLIPDMKHGMFVTVFYGVVSRESGELTYANAGHNPPFVVHPSEKRISKLDRTGMALGIMEGAPQQRKNSHLDPGDLLVCYTDGITEAFSESGDMFGEQRLQEEILIFSDRNASNLLFEIELAVRNFINDDHFADDLTMIAIRRLPVKI